MDDELRRILGTQFADEVLPLILENIQASYAFRRDVYSEDGGDDSMTFGIGVSRGALNLIERALDGREDVTAHRPQGSFVITGDNNLQLRCWKVGVTEDDEVESIKWEGSEAKKAPGRANAKQLAFELKAQNPPEPGNEKYLPNLVIGHLGNSFDGCCRVVIGTPMDGQGWHFLRDVWRIAETDVIRPTDLGPEPVITGDEDDLPDIPLRDDDVSPDVQLRNDDEEESGSSGPETA